MAMDIEQEKKLINQCIQGSREAWRVFINQYSPLVYYMIQKMLRSRHADAGRGEIDDLHNEIFLSIMDNQGKKLRQYEGKNGCTVSSWVRMIAVRATIDHLRKNRDTASLSDETTTREVERVTAPSLTPQKLLEDEEKKQILHDLIASLPPQDQLFLKLLYYQEVPPQDIAKLFNSSTNAVYSRGNYLREKLKEGLKKASKKSVHISSI
ncbi:MAG: sigma-70 family RNA polymerase sigma factor [Proteobacteria bacterium]|nr:sigma-70 family RNA polymerase sigma factor [Pseudomonadota bacterium]